MHIQAAIHTVFTQLSATLSLLHPLQYVQPCTHLSQATIGQHTRHVIEMFQCLLLGYGSGSVNYEKRKRDPQIENDPFLAVELLQQISHGLQLANKPLLLEASYSETVAEPLVIETNYFREIAYNLEHTIHHMALIKVGILEVSDLELPESFGTAHSTLQYRRSCAP